MVFLLLASAMLMMGSPAGASPLPETEKDDARIKQIQTGDRSSEKATIGPLKIGNAEDRKRTAAIGQLPSDAEAPADAGPEMNIGLSEGGPDASLYDQVAEVWTMIRRRGMQPTPELIAREIGPDALARFLDQYPGATGMFGKDQDTLPVDHPDRGALPKSAAQTGAPPQEGD